MTKSNPFTDGLYQSKTAIGVNTDGNGQVDVTLGELREIESVSDVDASAAGGYVANPVSVNGNTVTIEVRASAGTAGNELPLVTNTNGVTNINVRASGY